MEFNLSTIDTVIIAVYFVGIIVWGLIHSSRQSAEGYFLGGRGMKWPLVGLSMFAMVVSSSALVGWAGDAYSTGISVFNYAISGAIIVILFILVFFLPFYIKNNIYTLPEFLEGRYDAKSRYYFSGLSIISYTFLDASITLYAGALMLKMIFPQLEIWQLVAILAVVAASYTIIGGLSSVMWADMLQASLLILGSVVLTVSALAHAGGWEKVIAEIPKDMFSLVRPANDPSVPWPALIFSLPILGFYFWGVSQTMVQRTLSAKNINHGRWGNLFAAALNFVIFFVMVLPGIFGKLIFPDLENANMIYPMLVFKLLPVGLIGLVLAGFLAALTSTLSAILNSGSTLFTMDIASKINPALNGKKKIWVGNMAGIAMVIVAAAWAPNIGKFDSIVKYFQELLSYMTPPIVTIFIFGLFWKKANSTGAFAGLMTGFVLAILLIFFGDHTPMSKIHFLYAAPVVFSITAVVVIVVSLLTGAEPDEKIKKYVWTRDVFKQETLELKTVPWYKNFRVLSIIILVVTILFFIYWR